jgi:hypothetical protein
LAVEIKDGTGADQTPEAQQQQETNPRQPLNPTVFACRRFKQFGILCVLGNPIFPAHIVDHVDNQHAEPCGRQHAHLPNPQLPIDEHQIAHRGEQGVPLKHWCWWSTHETIQNEVPSVTAILETIIAVVDCATDRLGPAVAD